MTPPTFFLILLLGSLVGTTAFLPAPRTVRDASFVVISRRDIKCAPPVQRASSVLQLATTSAEQSQDMIARLIADDELIAFSLKLGEIVRDSVFECAKRFQFRPDQIAWEIDRRVKLEVAHMMGKKEFKLFDFIFALNKIGKEKLAEIAGDDEAELVEMSDKVDNDVRKFFFDFTGKEDADAEDIEIALQDRVQTRVAETLGLPNFSLESWAKSMDVKRKEYLVENLGQFGADRINDVTNMAMKTVTGKETYEFGDLTRKIASNVFGTNEKK